MYLLALNASQVCSFAHLSQSIDYSSYFWTILMRQEYIYALKTLKSRSAFYQHIILSKETLCIHFMVLHGH
jgi:hypothetical protein